MESELTKAVNLYEKGELNSAEKICVNIYKKTPHNFDNLRLLNFIYSKKEDYLNALNYINKAIKINPNFAEAYNEQGNAYNALKQLSLALKSYDMAININPNYADAYYNKAVVLQYLKKTEDSINNYDEAIKNNPNHSLAYNNRGFALQQLKQFDESLKSYQKAYKINPNFNFLLGKIIHTKSLLCNWDSYSEDLKTLENKLINNKISCFPFATLSLFDSPYLQKKIISKKYQNLNLIKKLN